MTEPWVHRFAVPIPYSARPARGPVDVTHVISVEADGTSLARWNGAAGAPPVPARPVGGDLVNSIPTADGRGVIRLRDDTGAELGHAWLARLDSDDDRDLTPVLPPYSLRGLDVSADDRLVLLTTASVDGFELWVAPSAGDEPPRRLFGSADEAWNGRISADGRLAAVDTTHHRPGERRFGVTVVEVEDGSPAGFLYDDPDGTARVIRFSPIEGDQRLLAVTERTGHAKPVIWNPRTGERWEPELAEYDGDVHPLDWSPDARRVIAAHVDGGVHALLELDVATGAVHPIAHPPGSVFQPDIASTHLFIVASHYSADGAIRITRERFEQPLEIWEHRGGTTSLALAGPSLPPGTSFTSHLVTAPDGVRSQLWLGRPRDAREPRPTILQVHGGPTFVTTDHFDPSAQAWVDEGFVFATLNYRGSVTFGRDFRESFLVGPGQGELDDIAAAVDWLVASGISDPTTVFITGESYGGYLTLMSLGKRPELFAGGLAFVAMADWALAYDESNPALRRALRWFFGGLPDERPEAYRRASALSYVEGVRAPLWLKNGTHDTRTPPRQITAYVDALRAAGGDVAIEWFDGGHQTASVDGLVADQRRMLELVRAAMRGEPWAEQQDAPTHEEEHA